MPAPLTQDSSILIIGGGTFALSTALHLARRRYTNITVLDRYPIPSPISAGNDANKIVEICTPSFIPSSNDSISIKLQYLASKGWRQDPVFVDFYHETGFIAAGCTEAAKKHVWEDEVTGEADEYVKLVLPADFRGTMPDGVLTGEFPGWEGAWKKKNAGWCMASGAMRSTAAECARLGVRFVTGDKGFVQTLLHDEMSKDVIRCKALSGDEYRAERTILAAGAGSDALLDMKSQLRPTAWTLCHLKMTEDEAKLYKNLPVLFNVEKGFFVEPDEEGLEMKLCDEHPGYCNWIKDADEKIRSVPFAKQNIPLEAERRARDFLKDCMPHLTDRPLSFARICWCADTVDRLSLVGYHSEHPSLMLACGGSGHGFAHIPSVGGIVANALEEILDPQLKLAFRWRPETAINRD